MDEDGLDLRPQHSEPGRDRVTSLCPAHHDGHAAVRPELTAYVSGEVLGLGAVSGRRHDDDLSHPRRRQHPPQGVPEDGHPREGHERLGHEMPET